MKHTLETIHFSKVVRLELFVKIANIQKPSTILQKAPNLRLYDFEANVN